MSDVAEEQSASRVPASTEIATRAGGGSSAPTDLSPTVVTLCAISCGATVANIYYAQSLVGPIARDLGLPADLAGVIVTFTQLGYGAGLFFLVCLGDIVENRRLILLSTAGTILGLAGVVSSHSAAMFLAASFLLGVASVGTQVLVPLAVRLSPEHLRGRVIGKIMVGLIGGIMLSRPLASFLAAHFDWRAVFMVSMAFMLATLALLWRILPQRRPEAEIGYGALLGSMARLLATSRPLQRRCIYQGGLFAAFNVFWTGAPLMLQERFGLSQQGIALFALAGAGGALAAPVAGRLADAGYTRAVAHIALFGAAAALLASGWATAAGWMILLVLAAVTLDAATQANQVISQRAVYGLGAEARGRLNAAYMTVVFLCGAAGSVLGSLTYVHGGWWMTALVGSGLTGLVLVVIATEDREAAA